MAYSEEHNRVEIGSIWYSSKYQRTFANTESVFLMLQYAFEVAKIRRVEWKCNLFFEKHLCFFLLKYLNVGHNENEKSKAAALRLQFKYEGLFRQHMIIQGRNRDTAWFSIIDSEWPEAKQAIVDKMNSYSKSCRNF